MTASTTSARKARKKPPRTLWYNALCGALYINVGKDEFAYWVDRLDLEACPGKMGFRLTKFVACRKEGQPDNYDVCLDPAQGQGTCECMGHLRHSQTTTCKHVAALLKLIEQGKL